MFGIRANFILKLLEKYNGGFTLLGDNCQAIYDYQANKEGISSKEFYETIQNFEGLDTIEYGMQKRQTGIAFVNSRLLRLAIQSKDEKIIENTIQQIMETLPEKELEYRNKSAILARTNREVYYMATKLKENCEVISNNKQLYFPSWIAYLFYDKKDKQISQKDFEKLVEEKLNITQKDKIDSYWEYCKKIENNSEKELLDLQEMKKNIILNDNEEIGEFEQKEEKIILSTIHKAKGKEFDKVYLYPDMKQHKQETILDYAKVLYVAITRAKEKCMFLKNDEINLGNHIDYYLDKEERYFEYYYKRSGKTRKGIGKIEIGLSEDVDLLSFVNENIIENAKENIEYIFHEVKEGDYVDIERENDQYYIFHKNRKIGKANIETIYRKAFWKLNHKKVTYCPKAYKNVKIEKVITVAKFTEFIPEEIAEPFKTTGLWIGLKLNGFGELYWKMEDSINGENKV